MVAAAGASPAELLQSLAETLPELVDAELLEIETQRSMRERLAGKPGQVISIRLLGPEQTLTLAAEQGRRPTAEAAHVVRGVVISRKTIQVSEWLEMLAAQLHALAVATATDNAAVNRMLSALGIREPASDLVVDPGDAPAGLRALPDRVRGRVPDDVVASVERICALLGDTLPRVQGGDPSQAYTVLRAVTDYLPRTLREYVALPRDWAERSQLPTGGTALDALRQQLGVLETAATRMRDAAVTADASSLLANGAFLSERFGVSDLELPTAGPPAAPPS
jgi:hypothetical protein